MKSQRLLVILAIFLLPLSSFSQSWKINEMKTTSDRALADALGSAIAIDGSTIVAGTPNEDHDENGNNYLQIAGSAYIFEKDSNNLWIEVQKIIASDRLNGDRFGSSIDISGNYLIVSSIGDDEDENGNNTIPESGSAYIFERDTSGVWSQVQKIVASDRAMDDGFGYAVSIDGNYAVVGVPEEEEDENGNNTITRAGSAYIFERDTSGVWSQVQKIVASDREDSETFGFSCAISGDYILIGANNEGILGTIPNAGAVYSFKRDTNGVWNQTQKLMASDRALNDNFSWSLALDGSYAIIGSIWDDEDENDNNTVAESGSAYIFERDTNGVWSQVQKIVASDRGTTWDTFGMNVSISGDFAIASTGYEDEDENGMNTLTSAGATYVFERNPTGIWNEIEKIVASDRDADDNFGIRTCIDSNLLIIGALGQDEDAMGNNSLWNAGAIYIHDFCRTNSSENILACNNYVWPANGTNYTSSGNYTTTLNNFEGCDSILTLNLTITNISNSITNTPPTLMANQNGATYQWLDCNNNIPISGEINQSFTATINGNYAVIINYNGCIDTSSCVNVIITSLSSKKESLLFSVHPNPTNNKFILKLNQVYENTEISIVSVEGRTVYHNLSVQSNKLNIDATSWSNGLYLITINSKDQNQIVKLIKQ